MSIDKLLSISSSAIIKNGVMDMSTLGKQEHSQPYRELIQLLSKKNGFYAFEGSLHVFPWIDSSRLQDNVVGLQEWNEKSLWRDWYGGLTDGLFFFAEDAFGGQFAIRTDEIVSFDPESGEIAVLAKSLEDWAQVLLLNYAELTGYPLAHSWQLLNGPIPTGKRLLPKVPFILGGSYEDKNLIAINAVSGMRYRGELWEQLRDLPDGAQVKLKVLPLQ